MLLRDMPCPACGGRDGEADKCPTCHGHGCEIVTGCPMESILPETWDLLRCADLARRGILPVAGGLLDQTVCFVQALPVVWSIEDALRAKLKLEPL